MHQFVDVSWPQQNYHPGAEEGVFVAATSGDGGSLFVQSTFSEDVANARAAGKALGFYHFNGAQSAAASAEAFWAAIKPYWRPGDLVALDIESYNGGKSPAESTGWAMAFAVRLSQLVGVTIAALRLGIYGNRSDMGRAGWGALERVGCWLWLAAPGGYPENTPIGEWSHWTILQYSSSGNVDRDESESTFAQIAGTLAEVTSTTHKEIEEPDMAQGAFYRLNDGQPALGSLTAASILHQDAPGEPLLYLTAEQWLGYQANKNTYVNVTTQQLSALLHVVGMFDLDKNGRRIPAASAPSGHTSFNGFSVYLA